jgi:hypothetical protein
VTYIHCKRDKPSVEHVLLTNDSVIALPLLLWIALVRSRTKPRRLRPTLFPRILNMESGCEQPGRLAPFDSLRPCRPFAVFNALLEKKPISFISREIVGFVW